MVLSAESRALPLAWFSRTTQRLTNTLVLEPRTLPAGGTLHNTLQINGFRGGLGRMTMYLLMETEYNFFSKLSKNVKGQKGTLNLKKQKMKTQTREKRKALRQPPEPTRRSPSETLQTAALAFLSRAIRSKSLQCLLGRRPKGNRKAHIKKVSLP